jgi:ABC-type glycerol-3-phosphate transport system substrate-binding protein
MTKKLIAMAAVALLAACGGDDTEEGADTTAQDTSVSTVQGTDTISQPTVVPTTDSVVTTTTTQTETDTVHGQATDTAAH